MANKYTYQDWVNSTITTEEAYQYFEKGLIIDSDMLLISKDQESAYLRKIKGTLNFLKKGHLTVCKSSFVQEDAFNNYIYEIQEELDLINEENDEIAFETLNSPEFGKLSRDEVEKYLYTDWETIPGAAKGILESYNKAEGFTQFDYIIRANLLLWLKWQLKQLIDPNNEPSLDYVSRFNNIGDNKPLGVEFLNMDKQVSYKWQNKPKTELPELYQLLLANKLIHADSTLEQFISIFSAKPLKSINPVRWHDDNASELLYFIQQLEGSDGSLIEKGERANYQRLKKCFVKPDGEDFTENFRQAKQNLKSYGLAPAKQQIIDNIIKQFY
ncbi:hypothetical protein [Pontibacter ruber]|uniref:Uncharacterized protein n=1 Tax=Pontibacter ruber TaxID=1343895 RepID=A0ABW5CWG6_9BACT|nr:hypothetical protein [Pontibacter ruber]